MKFKTQAGIRFSFKRQDLEVTRWRRRRCLEDKVMITFLNKLSCFVVTLQMCAFFDLL
jgi:hypothetical protein